MKKENKEDVEELGIPIYFNLNYFVKTIPKNENYSTKRIKVEDEDDNPFDYVIDFCFSEIDNKIVRTEIYEEEYIILSKLSQTEDIPQYYNIATLIYILRGTNAFIHSCFLSKNEEDNLDFRFMIAIPDKCLLNINLDVFTGIVIASVFECPINITKELFDEESIDLNE